MRWLVLVVCLLPAPAQAGQTATRLVAGDADRSLAVVWDRAGWLAGDNDGGVYRWTGPDGVTYETLREDVTRYVGNTAMCKWYGGARLPAEAKPGRWTLNACKFTGDTRRFTFDVAAPYPALPFKLVAAGAIEADVEKAAKTSHVLLAPGYYGWARPLNLPPGRILRGHGAVVASTAARVIGRTQDLTVEGVTFIGPNYNWTNGASVFDYSPGLVVRDCVFRRNNFGARFAEAVVTDCRFEAAGMFQAPRGLVTRCLFSGVHPLTPSAYLLWGESGNVALIDNEFHRTDRGPVFSTNDTDVTDHLILGTTCDAIAGANNGSEGILAEGPNGFHRNLLFTTRIINHGGPGVHVYPAASNNYVWDLQSDAPVRLFAAEGTEIFNSEFRAGLELGGKSNSVTGTGIHMLAPRRWSADGYAPGDYDNVPAVKSADASNVLTDCRVFGKIPFAGPVALKGTKVNGEAVADTKMGGR